MRKTLKNLSRTARILCLLPVLLPGIAMAQTSIFQDADGESAYKIGGSAVTITPQDANVSAALELYRERGVKADHFRYLGINAKVSANEGIANIKNENGFLFDGEIGLYHSWNVTPLPPPGGPISASTKTYYISANLLVDRNKLYNVQNLSVDNIYIKGYAGWKIETGIFGYKGDWLYGFSLNGGQKTNIEYLESNTITALQNRFVNDSNFVWKEDVAYDSSQVKGGLGYVNGNIDIGYLLNRSKVTGSNAPPLFFALNLRYRILAGDLPVFNPGVGMFISDIGAPQRVVLGLSMQLHDAFNVQNEDKTAWQRTSLNLSIGFKFGS